VIGVVTPIQSYFLTALILPLWPVTTKNKHKKQKNKKRREKENLTILIASTSFNLLFMIRYVQLVVDIATNHIVD